MSLSNAASKGLLDYLMGKSGIFDSSPAIFVALFTTDPTTPGESDAGSTEATGNGYAREEVVAGDWTAASDANPSEISNSAAVTFTQATGSWGGECATFGLYTLVTGGTYLGGDTLDTPKTPTSGDTPRFNIGDLSVTLT